MFRMPLLDLGVGILHFLDHVEILVDLAVSLVDVDDHVEVVGGAVGLGDLRKENILEHAHHDRPVDVLLFLEVLESVNESDNFFLFHVDVFLCFICRMLCAASRN